MNHTQQKACKQNAKKRLHDLRHKSLFNILKFTFIRFLSFPFLSRADFHAFVEMRVVPLQTQPASIVPHSNVNHFKPASTQCNFFDLQWTSFMICNVRALNVMAIMVLWIVCRWFMLVPSVCGGVWSRNSQCRIIIKRSINLRSMEIYFYSPVIISSYKKRIYFQKQTSNALNRWCTRKLFRFSNHRTG